MIESFSHNLEDISADWNALSALNGTSVAMGVPGRQESISPMQPFGACCLCHESSKPTVDLRLRLLGTGSESRKQHGATVVWQKHRDVSGCGSLRWLVTGVYHPCAGFMADTPIGPKPAGIRVAPGLAFSSQPNIKDLDADFSPRPYRR
jgi:hypothetical protein